MHAAHRPGVCAGRDSPLTGARTLPSRLLPPDLRLLGLRRRQRLMLRRQPPASMGHQVQLLLLHVRQLFCASSPSSQGVDGVRLEP
eukprot:3275106-Pyramimonas_sp.AAC.1